MTIRNRLVVLFSLMVVLFLLFFLGQRYAYTLLTNLNTNATYLNAINEKTLQVADIQRNFLIDYDQPNASKLLDALMFMEETLHKITVQNSDSQDIKDIAQLKSLLSEYKTLFKLSNPINNFETELYLKLNELSSHTSTLLKNQRLKTLNYLTTLRHYFVIVFSFLFLLIAILFYRLSQRISKSLTNLMSETESIASGDYSRHLSVHGNDEFSQLSNSINSMSQALKVADFSIKTYSSQLENMVEAKTYELTNAKIELEEVNKILNAEKEKFAKLAMTDILTGLNNRAYFIEVLGQKISESSRYLRPFSVMLLDIDFFKSVNDRFGHQVGDDVLKVLSDILVAESQPSDVVARYGGEEFMVIFSEIKLDQALVIADRIRITIQNKHFIQKGLQLTISAGLIEYDGESFDDLLKIVDDLLYQAKNLGRNRIETQLITSTDS